MAVAKGAAHVKKSYETMGPLWAVVERHWANSETSFPLLNNLFARPHTIEGGDDEVKQSGGRRKEGAANRANGPLAVFLDSTR